MPGDCQLRDDDAAGGHEPARFVARFGKRFKRRAGGSEVAGLVERERGPVRVAQALGGGLGRTMLSTVAWSSPMRSK